LDFLGSAGRRSARRSAPSRDATLAYLDEATFLENEAALADDPFPLAAYPSQDADGRAVDPYNPIEGQYPNGTGFDEAELAHGGKLVRRIAALPQRRADKLFAISGIGFDTISAITWSRSASRSP